MAGRSLGRGRVIPGAPFSRALSSGDEEQSSGTTVQRNPFARVARASPVTENPQAEPSRIASPVPEAMPKQNRTPPAGMVPSPPSIMDAGSPSPSVTGPLADRFSAVQEGIASGEMDPQGMNYTTFGPHVGMGTTPIARFLDAVNNFDMSPSGKQFVQDMIDTGPKLNREVLDTVPLSENVEDRRGEPIPQPPPDEEDLRKLNENIRI